MTEKKGTLTGKVILVTGAGRGLGSILSRELAAHGASLAINDLTPINLDQVEAQILAENGVVKSYIVDVSKKIPIQGLIQSVQDDFGRIDILIHCARVRPKANLIDMDDWEWQRTLDVNLSGAFFALQSVGRLMRAQGGGKMILVRPDLSAEIGMGAYSISMAALQELTSRAASEFKDHAIQVEWLDQQIGTQQVVTQILSICSESGLEE